MTSSNTPDDLDGASPSTSAVTLAQSGAECLVAADMLARQFAARASTRDLERQLPFEEFDLIRAHGLQAIRVPKKFGGPGGSVRDLAEMTRIISKG
ncbi:MAG: SfnB family sulfur acquisition oxidoreductase, partial [Rhodospirillaceae bacterium]|nr:SfnB family sulfur acquisition oxidoreductase [Rhodospirillaceae bacterium]